MRTGLRGGVVTMLALTVAVVVLDVARQEVAAARDTRPQPPHRLAETGLYVDGDATVVASANQPYSPQYPLWTDGASKRRWVFLPDGATIDASDDRAWVFPVGTKFWKEFAFEGRKVETRFLWRASEHDWVFASYRWNDAQTDAVLAPDDGVPGAAALGGNRAHGIPSRTDCRACHESSRGVAALGFNPLQLSTDRDPQAIHGEPLQAGMATVATLNAQRRLNPARADLVASPPVIQTSTARTRTVLGYLAANCGHCHNGDNDIVNLGASLKPADVMDGDAVARAMVSHRTSWQLPGTDGTRLINFDQPRASALLARMRSRRPSSQMPPLGTVVVDEAAADVMADWIATDLVGR